MPADDDVFYLQHFHGKLNDGEAVHIGVNDQIGDVPMDEHFARLNPHDRIGGHAAVGATDPKKLRRLLPGQILKESRIGPNDPAAQFRLFSNNCGSTFMNRISRRSLCVRLATVKVFKMLCRNRTYSPRLMLHFCMTKGRIHGTAAKNPTSK